MIYKVIEGNSKEKFEANIIEAVKNKFRPICESFRVNDTISSDGGIYTYYYIMVYKNDKTRYVKCCRRR